MKRCIALLLAGCLLSSCATMNRGRDEVISVESNPSGANATIQCAGGVSGTGTTPARLTIPRKADGCHVDVEKSGMKAQKIQLERGFNSSYWLNLIPAGAFPLAIVLAFASGSDTTAAVGLAAGLAGAAGLIVDRVTGAMYDHDPNVIKVTLQPEQ
ncbi:MAG: hypothetical protein QOC81_4407 [Thermoanaerobaculia bacterium]|jgi:hypothetical protein|nr:hypothetical protein [Thermoanaerobaculia bacterium]